MSLNPIPPVDRGDYFEREGFLGRLLARRLAPQDFEWARPQLEALGRTCGAEVQDLAWIADRRSPVHVPFDHRGERVDRVDYDASYRRMEDVGYGSRAVALKYDPRDRAEHPRALQAVGFSLGMVFGMAESGLFCPLCMTDGVARVLETAGGFDRDVKALCFTRASERCTGAMFLTEKQGGSDVGATLTRAVKAQDGWRLTGQKWFCSNVDAERALALARPEGAPAGTRGLGLFLLRKEEPDRSRTVRIDRIKEKLGVRSMPTGEVELLEARAELVGPVDAGFKQMAEMLNLSRLYNAVASASCCARAGIEAWSYARGRKAFGRAVADHTLGREMLLELDAERAGALHFAMEGVFALDRVDAARFAGKTDEPSRKLLRAITPIVKLFTAKVAVACASEAIEVHGGNGYIEDSSLPRLLRDAQVLPIWEGTTNILMLDLVRVARSEGAHETLAARAHEALERSTLGALGGARERTARLLERTRSGIDEIARAGGEPPPAIRDLVFGLARALESALLLEAAEREGPGSPEADAAERLSRKERAPSL